MYPSAILPMMIHVTIYLYSGQEGNFKNTNCCFIIPVSSHLMTYSLREDLTLFFLLLTGAWYSPRDETLPVLAMILVGKAKGETCYPRSITGVSSSGTQKLEQGCARMERRVTGLEPGPASSVISHLGLGPPFRYVRALTARL